MMEHINHTWFEGKFFVGGIVSLSEQYSLNEMWCWLSAWLALKKGLDRFMKVMWINNY